MSSRRSRFSRGQWFKVAAAVAVVIAMSIGIADTFFVDHSGETAQLADKSSPKTVAPAPVFEASSAPWSDTSGLALPVRFDYHQTFRANAETFVVGADGAVYHNYANAGIWVGWSTLGRPAAGLFGDVAWGTNYLGDQELFVRGNDSLVYHLYATPGQGSGWQGWDVMGAPGVGIRGDVHEGTNYAGNQELYVVGNDALVYHTFSTPGEGSGWSAWSSLGAPAGVSGDVSVVSGVGMNQILSVVAGGVVFSNTATPGARNGWGGWEQTQGFPATVNPMVQMVNDQRAAVGVGPVTENALLDLAAGAHSRYQAANMTMSHTGAGGSTPGERITAAGYVWWTWGENVAAGQSTATSVMAAWMNSPGHRDNILQVNFTNIGFGQSTGANGAIYWTMDLGAPS